MDLRAALHPRNLAFNLAAVFLSVVIFMAILAPILPMPSFTSMSANRLVPPSSTHWFGTDEFGRDLFARVVHAVRISLGVGLVGVVVSSVAGVVLGLVSGYFGGAADTLIMRLLDALLAFPSLLLAIGVAAIIGPGAFGAALALGIVGTPQMARIVRAGCLSEREMQYVEAARSVGTSPGAIMVRHLLPNVWHLIVVQMVLFFVVAVLTEAGLSFLGLGVQVPVPSLGSMLDDSRGLLKTAPWYALAPGITLTAIVLALNTIGDGLRDRVEGTS
jgi:peptide/nickel transport system permease protein